MIRSRNHWSRSCFVRVLGLSLHPQRASVDVEQRLLLLNICRFLPTHANQLAQQPDVKFGRLRFGMDIVHVAAESTALLRPGSAMMSIVPPLTGDFARSNEPPVPTRARRRGPADACTCSSNGFPPHGERLSGLPIATPPTSLLKPFDCVTVVAGSHPGIGPPGALPQAVRRSLSGLM